MQKILLSFVFIILTTVSCINRKDRTEHSDLIPEKTFVSILTDIYIANGLLSLPEIRYEFAGRDSVLNYIDIVNSYGYSYEKLNITMNYYFISRPKKLIRIYDQITRKISEMESGIQNELVRREQELSRETTRKSIYSLPDPEFIENPELMRTVNPPGTYTVTFSFTVYPDDQAYNPRFTAWFCDADSLETGKKIWLPQVEYIKDGRPHYVVYTGRIERSRPVILKAVLYDYENKVDWWDKHARFTVHLFNYIADPL